MFFVFRKQAGRAEGLLEAIKADAEALKAKIAHGAEEVHAREQALVTAIAHLGTEVKRLGDVKADLAKIGIKL